MRNVALFIVVLSSLTATGCDQNRSNSEKTGQVGNPSEARESANSLIAKGDPHACVHPEVKDRIFRKVQKQIAELEKQQLGSFLGEFKDFWAPPDSPIYVVTFDDYRQAKTANPFEMHSTQAEGVDASIGEVICSTFIDEWSFQFTLRQSLEEKNSFLMSSLRNGAVSAAQHVFEKNKAEAKRIAVNRGPIRSE